MSLIGLDYLKKLPAWAGQKDFSIDRIRSVASALGNPQDSFRSIHVAGTNGKGSVCSSIASILGAAGYKVGLTISPHLIDITERILIDGLPISSAALSEAAQLVQITTANLSIELSHFEAITLCAFLLFISEKVDFAIVEVGLGGRLDATNIISKPDISVITSIARDHEDTLGNTLALIAKEKGGIIKYESNCVVGKIPEEALDPILDIAVEKSAHISLMGRDFSCSLVSEHEGHNGYRYQDPSLKQPLEVLSSLLGSHQANNIGLAIYAARALRLQNLSLESIQRGLLNVKWPARLEFCRWNSRNILFDCAHNEAGIESLLGYLDKFSTGTLVLVFGVLRTKNWRSMVESLSSKIKHWLIIEPKSFQAVSSEELARFISDHDLGKVEIFRSNYNLLIETLSRIDLQTQIVVSGSIYMVGEMRRVLDLPIEPIWSREKNVFKVGPT